MSFLDKLKVKVEENQPNMEDVKTESKKESSGFLQLDVDIYQTSTDIYVIAPILGVDVKDLNISIENENDVVSIQGNREIPSLPHQNNNGEEDGKYLRQENSWGQFYRQIILPQEINVAEVEAKFKKGILILRLPILRLQTKGKKKIVVNSDK